jgi:DNA helicase-2/ATP-dependent DNA helicase PcrA
VARKRGGRRVTQADDQIAEQIKARTSFLVDAGAGSGKTYSLVQALTLLRTELRQSLLQNRQRVACITYTNVAKDEIVERTEHDELLRVSTIHDFLWHLIRPYQMELRGAVQAYNASLSGRSRRKQDPDELAKAMALEVPVSYSDRGSNFIEGRIHHDDLIQIAAIMFREHAQLCKLVGAQYPFILVDEYQDTNPAVVSLLLDDLRRVATHVVVGFFGDKAQAIYQGVVGELSPDHKRSLTLIQKQENYRCAHSVISVLNRFRSDIQQMATGTNQQGAAVYVGISEAGEDGPERALQLAESKLVGNVSLDTSKVLYLTHNLIAKKAEFIALREAYASRSNFAREQLQSGQDPIANFLTNQLDDLAEHWANGNHPAVMDLLTQSGFRLNSMKQREKVGAALSDLAGAIDAKKTIGECLRLISAGRLLALPDRLVQGIALAETPEDQVGEDDRRYWEFYRALLAVPSTQLRAYKHAQRNKLPYATKHGVKGEEFDDVLVVLDDAAANWNLYSFGNLMAGQDTSETRIQRSTNLLYVCMSRAKRNLVVANLGHRPEHLAKAQALFGVENVLTDMDTTQAV